VGQINSLPEHGELQLDRVYLRQGRIARRSGRTRRDARQRGGSPRRTRLQPGDHLAAIVRRSRPSASPASCSRPNMSFEAMPGAALPTIVPFGVFWMPYKELATAIELYGAFNKVEITPRAGRLGTRGIAAVDRLLEPMAPWRLRPQESPVAHPAWLTRSAGSPCFSIGFPLVFLSVASFMVSFRDEAARSRCQREADRHPEGIRFQQPADRLALPEIRARHRRRRHRPRPRSAAFLLGHRPGRILSPVLSFSRARLSGSTHVWSPPPARETRWPPSSRLGRRTHRGASVTAAGHAAGAASDVFRPALSNALRSAGASRLSFRMALRNIERRPLRAGAHRRRGSPGHGHSHVPSAIGDGIDYVLNYSGTPPTPHRHGVAHRARPTRALPIPQPAGVIRAEPFRAAAGGISLRATARAH